MDYMVIPLSMLVGFVAIFLMLLHVYGKLGNKKLLEFTRRLEALEKDVANLDIKSRELSTDIEEIKDKTENYVKLFKTVVHGFDYIVQGCKTALSIETVGEPDERIVTSAQRQQIPEAEGQD